MKMMKKVAQFVLVICLMAASVSMVALAANGKIMFEDPSTATGETLKLKGVIEADATIGDRTVVMSYDTEYLRFKESDQVTETEAGQLTYQVTGSTAGTRVEFFMNFDVLKVGTTEIATVSYEVKTADNQTVTCQEGTSKITIAQGTNPVATPEEPEHTSEVVINGATYTFTDAFESADIPEGFTEGTLEYDGAEYKVVENATMGVQLGYLLDAEGVGAFYMYQTEDATFVPFKQITISDSTSIVVLMETEGIVISDNYQQTTALVDGVTYPAWQDVAQPNYCILYALNSRGEKSLYQFDTVEQTYQRFTVTQAEADTDEGAQTHSIAGFLTAYSDYVVLGVGAVLVLFILLVIVLSVKLYNRNAELDELYDEYGIDLDDEPKDSKEEDMYFVDIQSVLEDDVELEETSMEETLEVENPVEDIPVEDNLVEDVPTEEVMTPEPVELTAEPELEIMQDTIEEETIPAQEDDILLELERVEGKAKESEKTVSVKDELHEIAAAVSDDKSDSFWADDLEDFEMDFIDLDD